MEKKPIKIILDTDIGDDIDDVFALALTLHSPEIELLGVTTVFRNAYQRAQAAMELISYYNTNIPVFAGVDQPLVQVVSSILKPEMKANDKIDAFGKYIVPQFQESMKRHKVNDTHAIDFIIETIHRYPHEVVLVPIGPLTNIAMAIRKDPTIIPLVKKIVMMGGCIKVVYPEWNIKCDPEAARIVYTSGIPIEAVGVDITIKMVLSDEDVLDFKSAKYQSGALMTSMMNQWFEHYQAKKIAMHDPLVIGTLIDSFVTFEPKRIQVQLNENRAATLVVETSDETTSMINVAVGVNRDSFFHLFKERLFLKD